jgi:hypothetical protein
MILNGILVESKEHLETLIVDFPEESQVSLRLLWDELNPA